MTEYLPLYAEKKCQHCGFYRGEHIGCSENDQDMACPPHSTFEPEHG